MGDSGIKIATAFCDCVNGANEIVGSNVFQDIAMRPALHGSHDCRILSVACQDQDPELRLNGQEPSAGFHAGSIGELHIEQHHLGVEALDQRHGIGHGSCLSHNNQVLFEVQKGPQSLSDQFVVINEDHVNRTLFHTGARMGSYENSAMI